MEKSRCSPGGSSPGGYPPGEDQNGFGRPKIDGTKSAVFHAETRGPNCPVGPGRVGPGRDGNGNSQTSPFQTRPGNKYAVRAHHTPHSANACILHTPSSLGRRMRSTTGPTSRPRQAAHAPRTKKTRCKWTNASSANGAKRQLDTATTL